MSGAAELQRVWSAALAAWPGVDVNLAEFEAFLQERVPPGRALADLLASPHASDLLLACACARSDTRALALFDARVLAEVPKFISKMRGDAAFVEEVQQRVRERLLTPGPARRPRIADYGGEGALGAWVRVAAVRVALNLRRANAVSGAHAPSEDLGDLTAGTDPELDYLKLRYRGEFKATLAEAMATLEDRDTNLLRLAMLDRLTTAAMGALYGVDKSTASRWLQSARERLAAEVQRRLRERLRLSDTELHSLGRLVESQLDLSLSRLLRKSEEP